MPSDYSNLGDDDNWFSMVKPNQLYKKEYFAFDDYFKRYFSLS